MHSGLNEKVTVYLFAYLFTSSLFNDAVYNTGYKSRINLRSILAVEGGTEEKNEEVGIISVMVEIYTRKHYCLSHFAC